MVLWKNMLMVAGETGLSYTQEENGCGLREKGKEPYLRERKAKSNA